jgi:DNA-binding response OmpR family regulator
MTASVNSKKRILVVDDDIDLNTTFALLLEFDGHEVRTAYTCEAAMMMIKEVEFDLIIVEYWLPGMRGDELASFVNHKWPDCPIILTAATLQDNEAVLTAKLDCILNKPFTMAQLREAMDWAFENSRKIRASTKPSSWMHFGPQTDPHQRRRPVKDDVFQ